MVKTKVKIKAFLKYSEYRKYILDRMNLKQKFFYATSSVILAAALFLMIYCLKTFSFANSTEIAKMDNLYNINDYFSSNNRNITSLFSFLNQEYYNRENEGIGQTPKSEHNNVKTEDNNTKQENVINTKEYEETLKRAKELESENKKLKEDNINLQNWVKQEASRGTRPRNYEIAPQVTSRSGVLRGEYLGRFTVTAYTPTAEECGNNKGITCSGHPIVPGVTVAVDRNYWPIGTEFYIKGLGYVMAMDSGGAIKGKNRLDFAVLDKNFAKRIGKRQFDVYLIKMGTGEVGDLNF